MSRYIDTKWLEDNAKEYSLGYYDYDEYAVPLSALDSAPSIDIVRCGECRKVREDGGHANCNGYLYCRKWKTLVDEDGYCSWGEREGE